MLVWNTVENADTRIQNVHEVVCLLFTLLVPHIIILKRLPDNLVA